MKMINFINKLFKDNIKRPYLLEIGMFSIGLGESNIENNKIIISKYPFEPSLIYPDKNILPHEISEIHLDEYPPTLKVGEELIFISREKIDLLKEYAIKNNIKLKKRHSNWDYITTPFLDTEYDDEQNANIENKLKSNGILKEELINLRKEIAEQMYKYNFDTMLWEWCSLGLNDVLLAMRPKLSKQKFNEFYWKAMEIEQRKI